MLRLILLIIIILFFLWLISNLFLKSKEDLNKGKLSKPLVFLTVLIISLLIFFILPRLGLNPLMLIQDSSFCFLS